ncbi:MAG: DoxX protein [Bacteroidota bacterium]
MNSKFSLAAKVLFAVPMIVFGANKFLLFFNAPPPEDPAAQAFMMGMFGSYLGKLVGITEMVGGILIFIPRTSLIGLIMLLVVTVNIVLYHLAHDLPGNGIWLLTLAMAIITTISQKDQFNRLIINHNNF